ncbi:MAG TPA: adenylate/guanylate cyclase domain-containing protein [Acidimicrobiia bacterium]|nr:adenylate/guanylate cyclase domain-containing protein [Acidimicrobiia bacterium]
MRVVRYFAFVDLSGFTTFLDERGDEESVRVLTQFRAIAREIATDFGVRIAKWLGDGCMLVAVEANLLVSAVLGLQERIVRDGLPLEMHAGIAGGPVILLEGDDYTGRPVNLASRLCDVAGPRDVFTTPDLASLAPAGTVCDEREPVLLPGMRATVRVVRLVATAHAAEAAPSGDGAGDLR